MLKMNRSNVDNNELNTFQQAMRQFKCLKQKETIKAKHNLLIENKT